MHYFQYSKLATIVRLQKSSSHPDKDLLTTNVKKKYPQPLYFIRKKRCKTELRTDPHRRKLVFFTENRTLNKHLRTLDKF